MSSAPINPGLCRRIERTFLDNRAGMTMAACEAMVEAYIKEHPKFLDDVTLDEVKEAARRLRDKLNGERAAERIQRKKQQQAAWAKKRKPWLSEKRKAYMRNYRQKLSKNTQ